MPVDISAEGWRIDRLIAHANGVTLVFALILLAALTFAFWSRGRGQQEPSESDDEKKQRYVLLAAALFFLFVDGYFFWRSNADLSATAFAHDELLSEEGALRIQVSGRQWAWDIRYPGVDGGFDTEDDPMTVGELVVPRGRPVVLELSSSDVVHALYLPNLRVKQDAIPGRVVRNSFRATETGVFDMACAQHCGVHHYLMGGQLRVLEPEDFDLWHRAVSNDARRMAREDERAIREEAARGAVGGGSEEAPWPELAPTRRWTWPWGITRRNEPRDAP